MRTFSGEALCEGHFNEMFERRVRATVREFGMIKKNEHVGVAVSGGKDSLVMLHLLVRLRERLPIRLTAILVDEGIAGYRPYSIQVAKAECRKLGVKLVIASFEKEFGMPLDRMLRGPGGRLGACTYCGVFRRTLLGRAAVKLKLDKLALGHNLDDMGQTVLMNLMRNEPARLARLGPMQSEEKRKTGGARTQDGSAPARGQGAGRPEMIRRIQPLARCPEKEVALWAVLHHIPVHFMSCPNAGEAMRQNVRQMLNAMEEKYPGTKARLFNAFLTMQPALRKGMESKTGAGTNGGGGIGTCPACGDASARGQACAACQLLDRLKQQAGERKKKNGETEKTKNRK